MNSLEYSNNNESKVQGCSGNQIVSVALEQCIQIEVCLEQCFALTTLPFCCYERSKKSNIL